MHLSNAVSMLVHRLRRWPNIEIILGEYLVFAGWHRLFDHLGLRLLMNIDHVREVTSCHALTHFITPPGEVDANQFVSPRHVCGHRTHNATRGCPNTFWKLGQRCGRWHSLQPALGHIHGWQKVDIHRSHKLCSIYTRTVQCVRFLISIETN